MLKLAKRFLKQAQSPGGSQLRWHVKGHVFLCADVNKVVVTILWHLTYSTVDEQVSGSADDVLLKLSGYFRVRNVFENKLIMIILCYLKFILNRQYRLNWVVCSIVV